MHHGRRVLLVIGIALATAGCGGSGSVAATAGPSSPAGTTAPEDSAAGAATDGVATEEAATEVPSTDAGVTGGTGGVCDLVTVAELSKAFGRDDIQTTFSPGPPDTCGYTTTDGTGLGAMVLLTAGGPTVFEALHQGSSINDVQGIGDKAFYSSETQLLVVVKGDAMLSVAVVGGDTDDARSGIEQAIAKAAVARM